MRNDDGRTAVACLVSREIRNAASCPDDGTLSLQLTHYHHLLQPTHHVTVTEALWYAKHLDKYRTHVSCVSTRNAEGNGNKTDTSRLLRPL